MEILIKQHERGDGVHSMTFIKKPKKDGGLVDELLITTVVTFLAVSDDAEKYLIAIGDLEDNPQYKIVTSKELKSKSEFAGIIRPYSLLCSANDFELLLNFWRVANKQRRLVYLKDIVGRYSDDLIDIWILDKEIIFKKIKNEKYAIQRANQKLIDEIKNNEFSMLTLPYKKKTDFCVGDNWYWIDNNDVVNELRPMSRYEKTDILDVRTLVEKWGRQYGNQVMNYALLGWFIACMYMDEVTEGRGSNFFPFFAVTGMTQTGKTSLISNYLRFWGLEAKPTDYTQVTPFVEIKQLGQVSCMPIWRDEYREAVGHSKNKETVLRSLYNMATLSKGTASQQLINYDVKTSLFISGEDSILDPATRRRCIYFGLSEEWKLDAEEWNMACIYANDYFPQLFYLILDRGFNVQYFREVFAYAKANLKSINDKAEEGICYAALGAVFGPRMGITMVDNATSYWKEEILKRPGLVKRDDLFEQFWETANVFFDVNNLWEAKEYYGDMQMPKVLSLIWYKEKTGTFYVNMKTLIKLIYIQGGLINNTNINQQACEAMLIAKLKGKVGRQNIDGKQIKGFEFTPFNIPKGSMLEVITANIRTAYQKYSEYRTSKHDYILDAEEIKELPEPQTTELPVISNEKVWETLV